MDYEYLRLKEKLDTPTGKKLYARFEQQYNENFANTPIDCLDYTKYKLIATTGDRKEYEHVYFKLRERFSILQILAINNDQYLSELEEILAYLCNQHTWVLPAHSHIGDGKFDYTMVDLYSAETAFYLSETVHIFADKLSNDIRERIKSAIKTKIIDNFESRTFFYECPKGTNWATVCGGSIGITYLYMFPERFEAVKERIFTMCESYIHGLHDDGVCEEGLSYWWYGFGFLAYFVDVYKQKFNEMPIFMYSKKIQKTLEYRKNAIVNGRGLPFADAVTKIIQDYPIAELTIKKLFPDTYNLPNYDFIQRVSPVSSKALFVRLIDSISRYENISADIDDQEERSMIYEDSQIFIRKKKKYTFLTKGGHNQEMHNHNDVGAFSLWIGHKRIVTDLGGGEYTWEYFNDPQARYGEKIFCCGSLSHSVPIIDGQYQIFGRERKAELLSYDKDNVQFEIMSAYGIENESLKVKYFCDEDKLSVIYLFKGTDRQLTFRFVSDFEPKITDEGIYLDEVQIIPSQKCKVSYKKYLWPTYEGESTSYAIDFSLDNISELKISFDFIINSRKENCYEIIN